MRNIAPLLFAIIFISSAVYAEEEMLFPNLPLIDNPKPNPHGHYPAYPKVAVKEGACGIVRIIVAISETGGVEDALILSAQPSGYFEESSLKAIRKWSFEPFIKDGIAIKYQTIVPVNFKLVEMNKCNPNKSFKADAVPARP